MKVETQVSFNLHQNHDNFHPKTTNFTDHSTAHDNIKTFKNTYCGRSSVGRASASQAECRGFESLCPLWLELPRVHALMALTHALPVNSGAMRLTSPGARDGVYAHDLRRRRAPGSPAKQSSANTPGAGTGVAKIGVVWSIWGK